MFVMCFACILIRTNSDAIVLSSSDHSLLLRMCMVHVVLSCSLYTQHGVMAKYIWSLSKPVLLLESWNDQGVLTVALCVALFTQGNQSFPLHVHGKPSDGLHVVTLFYVTPVGMEGEMPCSMHLCVCMHKCLHACVYSPIMHNTF